MRKLILVNMDDGAPEVFDAIHAELDSVPPETWTGREADQVLLTLANIRRSRNARGNVGCLTAPFARRRRFGMAG